MKKSIDSETNQPSRPSDYEIQLAAEEEVRLEQSGDSIASTARHFVGNVVFNEWSIPQYLKDKFPGWEKEDFDKLIDKVLEIRNRENQDF